MSQEPGRAERPFLASLIADTIIGGFCCCLGATLLRYSIWTGQLPVILGFAGSAFALLLLLVGGLRFCSALAAVLQRAGN